MPEASELFRRGTEAADRAGDSSFTPLLESLGEELLNAAALRKRNRFWRPSASESCTGWTWSSPMQPGTSAPAQGT